MEPFIRVQRSSSRFLGHGHEVVDGGEAGVYP